MAELVTYLSLAADSDTTVIDDSRSHVVTFIDAAARRREATFPVVIFSRERTAHLRPQEGPLERTETGSVFIGHHFADEGGFLQGKRSEPPAACARMSDPRDHVAPLHLELVLDEAEGYAYLRQQQPAEGEAELPRLVPRRQLSYPVSLPLALLRKKLAEFDARSGETRLVLSLEEIVEMLRLFLPNTGNEARAVDKIEQHVAKVIDLGFLRRLKGDDARFEVRRIVKTFVDAQWLGDLERRLAEYRAHGNALTGEQSGEV